MAVDSSLIMVTQLMMAPEMIPAAIMGTVILRKAFSLELPRLSAASSTLRGIC
jgi:hypothetical protein